MSNYVVSHDPVVDRVLSAMGLDGEHFRARITGLSFTIKAGELLTARVDMLPSGSVLDELADLDWVAVAPGGQPIRTDDPLAGFDVIATRARVAFAKLDETIRKRAEELRQKQAQGFTEAAARAGLYTLALQQGGNPFLVRVNGLDAVRIATQAECEA